MRPQAMETRRHCAYIHGYSRQYTFHFEANEMDEHGWVVGLDLKKLEKYFLKYDHTMIIAEDDPELATFRDFTKSYMI